MTGGAEWARLLELAESEVALRSAKAGVADVWEALGGWVVNFGPSSPLSQVLNAGMKGPVTEAELVDVETRLARQGIATTISLCPYADVSLVALMGKRGYQITHFEHTLARRLESEPVAEAMPFEVRPVTEEMFEDCTNMLCEAFFPDGEAPRELRELFPAMWRAEGARAYVAIEDGEVCASGYVLAAEGALLAGDGTRKRSRGRGMQSALIAARLRHAWRAGCRWATCSTMPGTASQRNYERAGFRVMYTKAMMVKECKR